MHHNCVYSELKHYNMTNQNICLICLCKGVKMYNYNDYKLNLYYEEVMPPATDGLPLAFCYLCAAMLYKFHKFKERCSAGQKILKEMLANGPITFASISKIDRSSLSLQSSIDIITINNRVKMCTLVNNSVHNLCPEDSLDNLIDYNSDKSIVYENTAKVEVDIEEEVLDVHEEKIHIDEPKIIIDEGKIISHVKPNSEINNLLFDESCDSIQPQYQNFAMQMQNIIEQALDKESTKSEVVFIKENVVGQPKQSKFTRKRKAVPRNAATVTSKPQDIVTQEHELKTQDIPDDKLKAERQRTKRCFDPEWWFVKRMTEDEAMEKFKARADDPKYIKALYKCTDCYTPFSREDILSKHINLVHVESRGSVLCHFCKRRFKAANKLTNHKAMHYCEYKCLRCNLVFQLEDSAARHDNFHKGIVKTCEICKINFGHLTTYYSHMRIYHRSEHVCTLCGASFVSNKGLIQHKKLKHYNVGDVPKEESKYCKKCEIKFETTKAYEEHFNESINHAPMEISNNTVNEDTDEECDRTFSTLVTLKGRITHAVSNQKHLNYANKSRGTKTCSICGMVFPSFYAYKQHHRSEHKDVPVDTAYIQICHICGMSIKCNSIASHVNSHTRSTLFPCPTCGMQFTLKSNMARHLLTHTVKEPSQYAFKCPLCDKRFTQKGSMQLHHRTKHLNQPYPKRNRKKKAAPQKPVLLEDGSSNTDDTI